MKEGIELSKKISEKDQKTGLFILTSLVVFSDKIIDKETSEEVRRWIEMTQIGRIFEEEKQEAVREAVAAKERAMIDNLIKTTELPDEVICGVAEGISIEEVRERRRAIHGNWQ